MKKRKNHQRATTFQIVGTFLVVISAFLLVAYVFIDQVRKDILQQKEGAKESTIITARKAPEYAQLSAGEAAYQAIYEAGLRGGYTTNKSAYKVPYINVSYGPKVPTAAWMNETIRKNIPTTPPPNIMLTIPEDRTLEGNLTEFIRNATLEYLRTYASAADIDQSFYANATFMVNRTKCRSDEYADMGQGCFNVTILTYNYSTKKIDPFVKTDAASSTTTHAEIRYFKMQDLMKSFFKNNFVTRTGSDVLNYNLLSTQLEADTACPAGSNCDWDVKTRTTQYCPNKNDCDNSGTGLYHAKLDYSCAPQLVTPACESTIKGNLKAKINEIESEINKDTMFFPYTIKCPSGIPNCEPAYNGGLSLQRDPATTNKYKDERLNWTIQPASPRTWNDVITWKGSNDDYNVLWWAQNPAGQCTLPQGFVYKTDNIADIGTERVTSQNNVDKDSWTKDTGWPSYTPNFPEGTACADAYYVDCHEVREYYLQTGSCTSTGCVCGSGGGDYNTWPYPTAWCEVNNPYQNDEAHQPGCGSAGPYGGVWCNSATTIDHFPQTNTCNYGCFWTTCSCSYTTCSSNTIPRTYTGNVAYTHCDIRYDFYGRFKYRARLSNLTITLTDESKAIPVTNVTGQQTPEKPQVKAIYNGVVYEEPEKNDRCLDTEGDEDKTGSRYYDAGEPPTRECPKANNSAAPRKDYYISNPC